MPFGQIVPQAFWRSPLWHNCQESFAKPLQRSCTHYEILPHRDVPPTRAFLICQDRTNASVPFPETRHQTVYYCKNHFEMSPRERIAKVFSHLSFHRCGRGQATGSDELYLNRLLVGFRVGGFSHFGFCCCGLSVVKVSRFDFSTCKSWASAVAAFESFHLPIRPNVH